MAFKYRNLLDYRRWIKLFKLFFWEAIRVVEHNPEHSTKITLFGQEINACSRCLGAYISGLIFFPIFSYIYLLGVTLPFAIVFTVSFILGSVTLVDWVSVKFKYRVGSANFRIIAGFLLGFAGCFYLFMLPVSWLLRLLSLLLYCGIGILIAFIGERDGQKAQAYNDA